MDYFVESFLEVCYWHSSFSITIQVSEVQPDINCLFLIQGSF